MPKPTVAEVIFAYLTREFDSSEEPRRDAKIKWVLKAKKIGKHDQRLVNRLRRLKNWIQNEMRLDHKSRYYVGSKNRRIPPEIVSAIWT